MTTFKDTAVIAERATIADREFVLIHDDHCGWWTTREKYDAAIAKYGHLVDGDYDEFCEATGEVERDFGHELDAIVDRVQRGEY